MIIQSFSVFRFKLCGLPASLSLGTLFWMLRGFLQLAYASSLTPVGFFPQGFSHRLDPFWLRRSPNGLSPAGGLGCFLQVAYALAPHPWVSCARTVSIAEVANIWFV